MDIRKIKKLIEMLEESDLAEIEIQEGEESLRISRNSKSMMIPSMMVPPAMAAAPLTEPPAQPTVTQTTMVEPRGARPEMAIRMKRAVRRRC